jgi:hypothetical protein
MPLGATLRGRLGRFAAAFCLGAVIGASAATARLGREMDRLTLDNAILMDEVERLAGELASRDRALTASRSLPVHSVEVQIESPLEEHVRLHVEQTMRDLLQPLVGEEIENLNPSLIEKALQRTVHVDKQDFVVAPTLIVLGGKLFVRLKVQEGEIQINP